MNHNIITQKRKGIMLRFFAGRKMRFISMTVLMSMLFQLGYPTAAWALTGGPSQPEVQSFEPVGTSEMVDLFSGDFNYNIPLLDVDGYPINIAYHSGITMDQEASWVGLGWNINPGVVNRNMRGLPDDFKGDEIKKITHIKENITWGITAGATLKLELIGKDLKAKLGNAGTSLSLALGLKNNNYTGWGATVSITPGISAGEGAKFPGNASLGINGSSDEGSSIQPNVGLQFQVIDSYKNGVCAKSSLGLSFGGAFNSRSGLSSLSVSASLTRETEANIRGESTENISSMTQSTSASWNFGMPTYTPSSGSNMESTSFTGKFSLGSELLGSHPAGFIQGYKSTQRLVNVEASNKAYGYLYSQDGTSDPKSLHDYNRENDGGFNESTPVLSMPNYTYDMFSLSGQGTGGSFRPMRGDIGNLYDPEIKNTPSQSINLEVEVGIGAATHVGGTIGYSEQYSESRLWNNENQAFAPMSFKNTGTDKLYETTYFKEANEKSYDPEDQMFEDLGGYNAVRVGLVKASKFSVLAASELKQNSSNTTSIGQTQRTKRQKRSQNFSFLTIKEAKAFAVDPAQLDALNSSNAKDHHIGEITNLGSDGSRYVYGLPVYNNIQHEVQFATGMSLTQDYPLAGEHSSGLVSYTGDCNSIENKYGKDEFYSKTTTPPYAHSYLLTSVLSSDYVDSDGIVGPTDGDLGSYTKFEYKTVSNYKWRTPCEANRANWNEGMKSDKTDDRASYVYGEKDLQFLEKIITKNYVAYFHLSPRKDACGVLGEDGGKELNPNFAMQRLDSISLYSRKDWDGNGTPPVSALPIKRVHFVYSYELCPGITNSIDNTGKLTLKEIYFTYQNSYKAKYSSYQFNYGAAETLTADENPSYNLKGYDRWGNFKLNSNDPVSDPLDPSFTNGEFPYTPQDKELAGTYAAAWSIRSVELPSGGRINIEYEADDYGYVQDKQAMQMLEIVGTGISSQGPNNASNVPHDIRISDPTMAITNLDDMDANMQEHDTNRYLYFNLAKKINENGQEVLDTDIAKYFTGIDTVFIKALVKYERDGGDAGSIYEYVPGYYALENGSSFGIAGDLGYVKLKAEKLADVGEEKFSPITKTAIQFARMNMTKQMYESSDVDDSGIKQVVLAIWDAFGSLREAFQNPNRFLYRAQQAHEIVSHKSMIRLNVPTKLKYGGGSRVKRIAMSDQWTELSGSSAGTQEYGQEYIYKNEDGNTSGVASYEPQIGGEENPWKQAIVYNVKRKGVPDEKYFAETPIGESFFPSPSVGYARVTVSNLQREGVQRHATGKVVHEFYTAKEFPTIVDRTDLKVIRHKNSPFSIKSLLKIDTKDYMTASQGFSIELNDMHGKPKSQTVYGEGQSEPLSRVEYKYKCEAYGNGTYRLKNECTIINPDGSITDGARIGVYYDVANDMREQSTRNWSIDVSGNTDVVIIPFPTPLILPSIWPSYNKDKTQFRSVSTTKVIQRFGILEETIAMDLGSVVHTSNLAYDSETGDVLLTETATNFEDKIYTFNYPGYWYYDEMGPAYQNIGLRWQMSFDPSGKALISQAKKYYVPGDELAITEGSLANPIKGWVVEVGETFIKAVDYYGNPINANNVSTKIIRSGRRNMQAGSMASITTRSNPLNAVSSNVYSQILQASAIEYTNDWQTFCECFEDPEGGLTTTNPYILGIKGYWKPSKSHLHLTGRTQSDFDNNTNIRKDGVFTSYSPFYKNEGGEWVKDYHNWTYTSEVTKFSPYGQEVENRDALGRYSAAKFGYNQSLATAVGANARYNELAFESFEYANSASCGDSDFTLSFPSESVTDERSHTGTYSLLVTDNSNLKLISNDQDICDPSGCGVDLNLTSAAEVFLITPSGGMPGYQFDYNILTGSPLISINDCGGLEIDGTQWMIEVICIDSNGCQTVEIFQNSQN
jgi:hypothetical protein